MTRIDAYMIKKATAKPKLPLSDDAREGLIAVSVKVLSRNSLQ